MPPATVSATISESGRLRLAASSIQPVRMMMPGRNIHELDREPKVEATMVATK